MANPALRATLTSRMGTIRLMSMRGVPWLVCGRLRSIVVCLAAVCGGILGTGVAYAADSTGIFNHVRRYVVSITADSASDGNQLKGSGVIIGANEVVTNCHVVGQATNLIVEFSDHERATGTLGGKVENLDLCVLRVRTSGRARPQILPFASIKVGQKVFALGSPLSLSQTFTDGIVSGLRQIEQRAMIQTTASISPGSSGGGLFDSSGRLLGITTFTLREGQNLNFAIPAEYAQTLRVIPPGRDTVTTTAGGSPFTFKGLAFGTLLREFLEAFPGADCRASKALGGGPIIVCKGGPIEYLGRGGVYSATFVRERLSSVVFTWGTPREDSKAVARTMQGRVEGYFGKPTYDRWSEMGPGDMGHFASWRIADGQEISLSFCETIIPIFCDMPSVTATLSHKRFSSEASPSRDF